MDELPSAEFRRRYASLGNPTKVTVNGHPIGIWTPLLANGDTLTTATNWNLGEEWSPAKGGSAHITRKTAQAERDAILRRISGK